MLEGDRDLDGEVDDVAPDMEELDEPPLVEAAEDAPAVADHDFGDEVLVVPPDGEDVFLVPQPELSSTLSRDLSRHEADDFKGTTATTPAPGLLVAMATPTLLNGGTKMYEKCGAVLPRLLETHVQAPSRW